MKPGKSSTEFWLIVAAGVMLVANGSAYVNVPWDTVHWFVGMVIFYATGRQGVKAVDRWAERPPPAKTEGGAP